MHIKRWFNLVVSCACLLSGSGVAAQDANLGVYTSPIDITGWGVQLVATAPDRETGNPVDVTLPPDLLGPKISRVLSTPISELLDQYWNTKDPRTDLSPREAACVRIQQQVSDHVAKHGPSYHAYDISCDLAATGQLLVKQVGSTLILAYLLTGNTAAFASTSPQTCQAGSGSPFCLNDPRFSVRFATEIVVVVRTPSACGLVADKSGTVYVVAASISPDNAAAEIDKLLGEDFVEAELAITDTTQENPLPIEEAFEELRTSEACSGSSPMARMLASFSDFETVLDPARGIVLHATHPGIRAPSFMGFAEPGDVEEFPSFFRPTLSTSQPRVTAGNSVQLSGRYFPPNTNLATELHLILERDRYNACAGGGTELAWGLAGSAASTLWFPAGEYGACLAKFDPTELTPNTAYQFRARDCDAVTCSPWSDSVTRVTEALDLHKGEVDLQLDGVTALGTGVVDALGTFMTSITIPAGTAPGKHTIHAAHRDGQADVEIQVADPASQASIMVVGLLNGETGCPNHPLSSTATDYTFRLFGSGFASAPVTIQLDTPNGALLGNAAVGFDGSFCQDMQSVPGNLAGTHTLVAVQNATVVAQAVMTFVVPSVVR